MWFDLSPYSSGPGSAPNLLSQAPRSLAPFPLLSSGLRMTTSMSSLQAVPDGGSSSLLNFSESAQLKSYLCRVALLRKQCHRGSSCGHQAHAPPVGLVALLTGTSPGSGMLPLARWAECWLGSPPPGRWSRSQLHELPGGPGGWFCAASGTVTFSGLVLSPSR